MIFLSHALSHYVHWTRTGWFFFIFIKMSQTCAIPDCKRASRTLCHCCNQNLCRDHFNQHDDLLNSQLNPLADEVNALADRLTAINIPAISSDSLRALDQWRVNAHQTIDRIYENKCRELDQYVQETIGRQRKEVANLRSKIGKLIDKQETTREDINSLTSTIRMLEQQMTDIENDRVKIDIRRLEIDESIIRIGKPNAYRLDLSTLPPATSTIGGNQMKFALANHDRFLLAYIDGHVCLIDENLSIIRKSKQSSVDEMCWSPILQQFLMINDNNVYSIDPNTLTVKQIKDIQVGNYWTCGCSNKSLYLSQNTWNSTLLEFSLSPSIQLIKSWKTTDQEQRIDAIVYNNETLALTINHRSNQERLLELRSSQTFSRLWSIRVDVPYYSAVIRCCSLPQNEWLLCDWRTSTIFHITNEGKMERKFTYSPTPCNITLFRSNILVVVTEKNINFHQIPYKHSAD